MEHSRPGVGLSENIKRNLFFSEDRMGMAAIALPYDAVAIESSHVGNTKNVSDTYAANFKCVRF